MLSATEEPEPDPALGTLWRDRHTERGMRTGMQPRRSEPWYQRAEAEENADLARALVLPPHGVVRDARH